MTRKDWKAYYRLIRIIRRETHKAHMDCMIYGRGFVLITDEPDYIRHVPIGEVDVQSLSDST